MVQRPTPAFGSGDSYVQIILDLGLPDEVVKTPWPQAGIKWYVLTMGFTRYNASYFDLPLSFLLGNPPLLSLSHGRDIYSLHEGEVVI